MESNKELKLSTKKSKKATKQTMESTIESVQQVASEELDKAKARFVGGRSIDRGNPEDDDENIQSDDEGMIEEIVTTVEEDKDLECKVKKKIETKKTVAQDPETHNKITKVVKTEVTEITRTITINNQHDLERAKRELGIDDVSKLLPSTQIIYNLPSTYHTASSWVDHPRLTQVQEKHYEPSNEIVTSGDFPSDSPIKQHSPAIEPTTESKSVVYQPLADATTVGRGAVVETISSPSLAITTATTTTTDQPKPVAIKKTKKSGLNLCSCTRSTTNDHDGEQRKQKTVTMIEKKSKQKKKASVTNTNTLAASTPVQGESIIDAQIQGQQLISSDMKDLITNKKLLIIDYVHSKVFIPSQLFTSNGQDVNARKVSSRILDLLLCDRCSSWAHLSEQVKEEYSEQLPANRVLQSMNKTYEDLFTKKQSHLLNTFSTIHHEKDMKNLPDNPDYITIVQTHLNEEMNQPNIGVITKPFAENIEDTLQHLQHQTQSDNEVTDDGQEKQQPLVLIKQINMSDDTGKGLPMYNEEQLSKMLANISQDKPITLAEAIAYQHIDLEDPKLGLSNDTIQCIRNLFRPLPSDEESTLNLIRIKRSGKPYKDFNLSETNPLEKFHSTEPFIYQLQQSFEPTLDFNEKQFRSLTETILNNKDEYSTLQFDIGRTLIPTGDMKESSTNDFSQSDSAFSMTTTTHESLASKLRNEIETITEPISDESDKTLDQQIHEHSTYAKDLSSDIAQQTTTNTDIKKELIQLPSQSIVTNVKAPTSPVVIKKRKSSGLFSCFGSKKSKASTEQHGQPTLNPILVHETSLPPITNSLEDKPKTDYAVLPDGKRIYIDVFRNRPGFDMSYQPDGFDSRFVLPATTSPSDCTRPDTPETTTVTTPLVHLESQSTLIDSADIHREIVEETSTVADLALRTPIVEPVAIVKSELTDVHVDSHLNTVDVSSIKIEEQLVTPLELRAPTIESVDVKSEIVELQSITNLEIQPTTIESVAVCGAATPIIISSLKTDESTVSKPIVNLHGASVSLPEIELVKPGPLPTLSLTKDKVKVKKQKEVITTEKTGKVKKPTGGLCASCFGSKAAEKKKKETLSETVKAPIEQKKIVEVEKIEDIPLPTLSVTTTEEILTTTIETTPPPPLPSITDDTTIVSPVYIDAFRERHFEKTTENLPELDDRLNVTIEKLVVVDEPHYQLPSSEPVPLVTVENEYSLVEANTYDIPSHRVETPSIENIQINIQEKILSEDIDISLPLSCVARPCDELLVSKNVDDNFRVESIIITEPAAMPHVDINDTSAKGSYTLSTKTKKVKEPKVKKEKVAKVKKVKEPKVKKEKEVKVKKEKTSSRFTSVFRPSNRKLNTPTLDLPSVECDLTVNKQLRDAHRHDSDPLRVPNIDLPSPDVSLPTFDRPEVNMTSGQTQHSSEFSIPSVALPAIPDLQLPNDDKHPIDSTTSCMNIPHVQLPDVQFTYNEQTNVNLPEIQLNTPKKEWGEVTLPELPTLPNLDEKLPELPVFPQIELEPLHTVETGLALASPVHDMLSFQVNEKEFPIETDYAIKLDSIQMESTILHLPNLSSDESNIVIKPELLSTEQKYTITDTHFVTPPALSLATEKQISERFQTLPQLPQLTVQLPSTQPVLTLSKDIDVPSVDDHVLKVDSTTIVSTPEIDILPPVKSLEKQVISPKSEIKKKSSTPALCSCFGTKSNVSSKEKTKTLAASKKITVPTADLPSVDLPVSSSNISSTLKSKDSLRAPTTDLPPVAYKSNESEPIRLPAIHHTQEKKRTAPKIPTLTDEKQLTISPEAIVPTQLDLQATTAISSIEIPIEEELLITPLIIENEEIQLKPISPTPILETNQLEDIQVQLTATPPPIITNQSIEQIQVQSVPIEKELTPEIKIHTEPKRVPSSFEIKAPALTIPDLDLSGPPKSDAYISLSSKKAEVSVSSIEPIQSRSDSGLEAIISSHLPPSFTFSTNPTTENLHQHTSISSGLGSEITDSITMKGYTLPDIQHETITNELKLEHSSIRPDFTRKITMSDESRSKLIFRRQELEKCLESEISKSVDDFDAKKDQKTLNKVLTHAIDLIKDKKVSTYPELKQKLIVEHKADAFIVDPVVRSLYCTMEHQGLDNLDKPEFPLAIRDMVRLPAKQTYDTVTQLNKTTTEATPRISHDEPTASSCLACGRSKSKQKKVATTTSKTTNAGLLDERRRLQLNTHRNELGSVLRDHIQSSRPALRHFSEHPKEVEKIIRKSLTSVTQPKVLSYEQIRNDLKTEYKPTFYLVDPIIDIVRDTFDHCDITQMNEKINLDILDSHISQTAQLYNQVNQQANLLTKEESTLLESKQLTWVNSYLIDKDLQEKKITAKQNKELSKILARAMNILSLNLLCTWDELNSQLRREFPKSHNLCDRAVELIKQAQKDGLLVLNQSPNSAQQDVTSINIIQGHGKRRASASLLTDRAKQNLKNNRNKIVASMTTLLYERNKPLYSEQQIESYLTKAFHYLEEQKTGQFKDYNDLKIKLKKDYKSNHDILIEQIVDIIEQAHATHQFDDIDKPEVQTLMKDRLDGKPLVIKEMFVSLPPRVGAYGTSKHSNDESSSRYLSTSITDDPTLTSSTSSHRVARGLSWREANERARILFYRGKHPAIHYDEKADGFDVRMLLETTAGGTQEIPVTDSDVHELLNSCGVQWDGVNMISLVDHSDDVVRAAEQAALKVIREKGLVDVRTPPPTRNADEPPATS